MYGYTITAPTVLYLDMEEISKGHLPRQSISTLVVFLGYLICGIPLENYTSADQGTYRL